MSDKIIIVIVCSENYLENALLLINSIEDNSNLNYKIYLHLIKVDPKSYATFANKFQVNTDKIEIFHDSPTIDKESKLLLVDPTFGRNLYTKFTAYCANSRVLDFKKLLDRGEKYLLYMDADSIVRKDLKDLFSIIIENDISLNFRYCLKLPNESYEMINPFGCATGIIGIRNSEQSINFVNDWYDKLNTNELLYHWYSDQNILNHLLVKNIYKMEDVLKADKRNFIMNIQNFKNKKCKLEAYNLKKRYTDWDFDNNSPIWIGKGNRKNSDIYIKEAAKYSRGGYN